MLSDKRSGFDLVLAETAEPKTRNIPSHHQGLFHSPWISEITPVFAGGVLDLDACSQINNAPILTEQVTRGAVATNAAICVKIDPPHTIDQLWLRLKFTSDTGHNTLKIRAAAGKHQGKPSG